MSPKARAGVAILAVATLLVGTALAQEPSLSQVYQAAESGNLTQAQRMMDEVLRTHPNSAKAHFVEAELLARQGRSAAAEAELNTAERLEPGLPFARAQAVEGLKRRVTSSRVLDAPGRAITPGTGSGISWTTVLLGAAIIGLIFVVVRAMRRSTPTYLPAGSGTAYGAPPMTGYGATAPVPPLGGGLAGPTAPGSGGVGAGILGGLATGAALGAGMVAGEALAHRLGGGHSGVSGLPVPPGDVAQRDPDDMGGPDFGITDSSSWDDNFASGGGGGDDWS
jgi:uncharacterized protein